ncbi:APC family permease [Agromyces sp. MMS24-JH15]|uniref:APC family permease n=1 Tax=Agromyces sp. MMS24-JH15 TaxID=3243765 RepID=UPI00374A8565
MTDRGLARRITLGGAVAIGLASMIGAGVFSAFGPAAGAAGDLLLVGLAVAAFVAFANAASTAQLAARHPESGGAYRFGRLHLGEWPGFLAGWGFVVGKTASCAAMALTAADYLVPDEWERPTAIVAVVAVATVNLLGITRTTRAAAIIVAVVLAVLALVVVAGFGHVAAEGSAFGDAATDASAPGTWAPGAWAPAAWGVLQSAGLLFFAFAGYARVATLGEEVVAPRRTIPRAVAISLGIVVAVYALVGTTLLAALGGTATARSDAPLTAVVAAAGWAWAEPIVRGAAALAALGALLALLAGIGRTTLAMARDRELPSVLAGVHPRTRVPWIAEIAVALVIVALVATVDLRGAIGFSSFGVLAYYLVANASALRQPAGERLVPRWLSVAGAIGCLVLAFALPIAAVVGGVAVFAAGTAYRLATTRWRRRPPRGPATPRAT